jgi:uncharacterized membrane protein YesL
MDKKPPIFKRFKNIYKKNLMVLLSIFWVLIYSIIGALLTAVGICKHWIGIRALPTLP